MPSKKVQHVVNDDDCQQDEDSNPQRRYPLGTPSELEFKLNRSFGTQSTMSTSCDDSRDDSLCSLEGDDSRGDSLCSLEDKDEEDESNDDCDIEAPQLRHRASRSSESITKLERNEEWLVPEDKMERKSLGKRKPLSAFVIYAIVVSAALVCVILTVGVTKRSFRVRQQQDKWKKFLQKDAVALKKSIRRKKPAKEYTIVLKGSRLDLIQQSLDAHSKCSSVREIQTELLDSKALTFSFNSKAVPFSDNFSTDGVFLLSEDVVLSCEEIERAFEAWRKDPIRLVGFYGFRRKDLDGSNTNASGSFDLEPVHSGTGPFSMVSDRAVFVHKRYLSALSSFPNPHRRQQNSKCCPVLLSLQTSAISSKSPLVVKAHPRDMLDTQARRTQADESSCYQNCLSDWFDLNSALGVAREGSAVLL